MFRAALRRTGTHPSRGLFLAAGTGPGARAQRRTAHAGRRAGRVVRLGVAADVDPATGEAGGEAGGSAPPAGGGRPVGVGPPPPARLPLRGATTRAGRAGG